MSTSPPIPPTTKALRILQPTSPSEQPYTATNPAPPSSLSFLTLPNPLPITPTQILIHTKSTTIIRDNLTWPELYTSPHPAHPGNDFAGIVLAIHPAATHTFKPGDEAYGMAHAHRGGTWAQHVLVEAGECARKPASLSWAEAAALPLSALTADQALFAQAGVPLRARPGERRRRVLVTGAAGGVGMLVVSFASAAGCEVVGATSDEVRDGAFLAGLGAGEAVGYVSLSQGGVGLFDAVVDTVGGEVLRSCWGVVKSDGALVSVDSASWDFVREHEALGLRREGVRAGFFIVEPEEESMRRVGEAVERGGLKGVVKREVRFEEAREAYERVQRGEGGRGKVVLVFD